MVIDETCSPIPSCLFFFVITSAYSSQDSRHQMKRIASAKGQGQDSVKDK